MFLQVVVITVPGVSDIFKVTPLGLWDWCMVIGFALMPVFVNEAVKAVRRIL